MLDSILQDAQTQETALPTDTAIQVVGDLCTQLSTLESKIAETEEALKELQKAHTFISEQQLPETLRQYGLKEIKLLDGSKISVSKQYLASITQEHREQAFSWLRDNNNAHLIKEKFEVSFSKTKKGEKDPEIERIVQVLKDNGIPFTEKGDIPWQTLRAFVREQLEDSEKAETFPKELFSVYVKDVAKIKRS